MIKNPSQFILVHPLGLHGLNSQQQGGGGLQHGFGGHGFRHGFGGHGFGHGFGEHGFGHGFGHSCSQSADIFPSSAACPEIAQKLIARTGKIFLSIYLPQ